MRMATTAISSGYTDSENITPRRYHITPFGVCYISIWSIGYVSLWLEATHFFAFPHQKTKMPFINLGKTRKTEAENICGYDNGKGCAQYKNDMSRGSMRYIKIDCEKS